MKGIIRLEYNQNNTNSTLIFTPSSDGEECTERQIKALLQSEKVIKGIKSDSIKEALSLITQSKGETKVIVAESKAPIPESDGIYIWNNIDIPPELNTDAERIFKLTFEPDIRVIRTKPVKVKKKVNKKMETNVPGVYAIGDAVGTTYLAHGAFAEAEIRMVGKITYDETKLSYITAWVSGRLDT